MNHDNSLLPQSMLTPMGARIRKWRESQDLTQPQLADLLGVSVGTLKNYLSGNTAPTLDKVIRLADLMEISIDELVGRPGHASSDQRLRDAQRQISDLQRENAALHEALSSSHARIKDKDAHIRDLDETVRTQRISIKRSSIFMISLAAALAAAVVVLVIKLV